MPTSTVEAALFSRAAAADSTATKLFTYEGFPSTKPSAPLFGPGAPIASTQPARYGRNQYEAVSVLLDSAFARSHVGGGSGSVNLFA